MPTFYLNTDSSVKEFYTDKGNLRDVLLLARPTEFVRFTYLMGVDDIDKRHKTIYNNKTSSGLHLLRDWLPADLAWKRILGEHLHVYEFRVEFDSGIVADCKAPQDLIITFKEKDDADRILEAFSVHLRVRSALLTQQGSLYSANQRTGSFEFMGYFKTIRLWLKLSTLERKMKKVFAEVGLN
ncbi:MAG: hypothetical protein J0L87_01450 [Bacteroidetes bacterium]|nr:hypothetical protein [Bacteroidota bacterium]